MGADDFHVSAELATEGTHMWCGQFNCWCDDVTELVDIYPICDGDCEGCTHLELVKPPAVARL